MRSFQKLTSAGKPDDASTRPPDSAQQREAVVEVMTHKAFINAVLLVNPKMTIAAAEAMYVLCVLCLCAPPPPPLSLLTNHSSYHCQPTTNNAGTKEAWKYRIDVCCATWR